MGPTSGAAYHVAAWYAWTHPGERVVATFPDEGHRYAGTVYNDAWLRRHSLLREPARAPRTVDHPAEVAGPWTRFAWNRRSREQVLRLRGGAA
jgi:hypothetical protein